MTAVFLFEEGGDGDNDDNNNDGQQPLFPRPRRDTVSSFASFDDRWAKYSEELQDEPSLPDLQPKFHHFGWDATATHILLEEEDDDDDVESSSSLKTACPPIPIPHRSTGSTPSSHSSTTDEEERTLFAALHHGVDQESPMNRKMLPTDFEH